VRTKLNPFIISDWRNVKKINTCYTLLLIGKLEIVQTLKYNVKHKWSGIINVTGTTIIRLGVASA
jgi:hypothetical protein